VLPVVVADAPVVVAVDESALVVVGSPVMSAVVTLASEVESSGLVVVPDGPPEVGSLAPLLGVVVGEAPVEPAVVEVVPPGSVAVDSPGFPEQAASRAGKRAHASGRMRPTDLGEFESRGSARNNGVIEFMTRPTTSPEPRCR
jgi:hypothetical protein